MTPRSSNEAPVTCGATVRCGLMGLVAKNAILLLDAARAQEAVGMKQEFALMAAGRKRLRSILMTTFALIAGMLPVAIGVGEGGEFYRLMALVIGGTITSMVLTLLGTPSYYGSIETSRDRAVAKYLVREEGWNPFFAFIVTLVEALLTLLFLRFVWRLLVRGMGLLRGRPASATP